MIRFSYSILISLLLTAVLPVSSRSQNRDQQLTAGCLQVLSEVMIHDITSPLVASRDYAYSMIAFYEAARYGDSTYLSYSGQLNGLGPLPGPQRGLEYDWFIAGAAAFYKTGYALVFSKDLFQKQWDSLSRQWKDRPVSAEVKARSVSFGEQTASLILAWAKGDNYNHTRTLARYTPSRQEGRWQQTPPDYAEAIEPYWNQIRPMVLASPGVISMPAPAAYKSPRFMQECREVLETSRNLSRDQTWMANFWDCNPFATQTVGHLMYSIKKISPGGHWMGITGIAVGKSGQKLTGALATYSLVSVALFDAFIACWDEKFKTNYIRPVTAIQQLMVPNWDPQLQTPPFPEYPSGHSVISMASAAVLTRIFGDGFGYQDTVEKAYGVESRSFTSFNQAAREAAISRLYGGIHFREAIENGSALGEKIGAYILEKIRLRKGPLR